VNHVLTNNTWEFGGLLSGLPDEVAWEVFGVVLFLGLVLAWLSYRRTLRPLTRAQRLTLITLRMLFLATLLLCLANPVRVERTAVQATVAKHRLAVVVDRSDSMTTEDSRGRSRLSEALRTWRHLESSAVGAFDETHYYSLAKDLRPAANLEAAATRTGETGETWLYQSLLSLLAAAPKDRPDHVVVLTDGLDTTTDRADQLVTRALTEGVSLYFVSGANRLQPQPFLRVRELRAPATALRDSEFALEGTVEAYSKEAKEVPFSLWHGNERLMAGIFTLTPGHNVLPWKTTVNSGDPGELNLVLRMGTTDDAPAAAQTATHVVAHEKIRVLFYQGALDWGFRYLIDALQTDPSFDLTSLINPALKVTLARSNGTGVTRLPDTVEGYQGFDFVILAHLFPAQLSSLQQRALMEFVRRGGDLLFTSPDLPALPQFTGLPLTELLPVDFKYNAADETARELLLRRQEMQTLNFNGNSNVGLPPIPLTPFSLTPAALMLPIFAQAGNQTKTPLLPRFTEYAPVSRAKPGAEVLAVHPTERDPVSHEPYILLATQIYGRGRTAILTTDGLWHWKLNEPSTSRIVETFWQQLMLWLGEGHQKGLRFADAPAQVAVGDDVPLRLSGTTGAQAPDVTAVSPLGEAKPLTVQPSGDPDAPWTCTWTAATSGEWELRATGDGLDPAKVFLYAIEQPRGELAQTPPAVDQMRAVAESTRGLLLDENTPATWSVPDPTPPTIVNEQRTLLWDRWPVLALAFGAYALELCLRRRWRLL